MARIIAGLSCPHTPMFPLWLSQQPDSLDSRCFEKMRAELSRLAPDVMVAFVPDHLNTFFYDNLPAFAVAAVDSFDGPCDEPPVIVPRDVASHKRLGESIHREALANGFDLAVTRKLAVDHAVMVPLNFLTPTYDIPVVPVYINAIVPPLPRSDRAYALGRRIGEIIRTFPEDLRVALLATGSITLEVGGPRINAGEFQGSPDPSWLDHVLDRLRAGEFAELAEEATVERLERAGNAAAELNCILAMHGALDGGTLMMLEPQPTFGHAYGVWVRDTELEPV